MPRKRLSVATVLLRGLLGFLGTQLAVVIGLVAVNQWRKRVRPRRADFPRTPPKTVPVGASEFTVYTYGEDLYRDMLEAIRGARHRIMFESFIVKGDATGRRFKRALIEAADRGVEVYFLYDSFANLVVPRKFFRFPPGIHVLAYPLLRPGILLLDIRKSGRAHRKILTVDGEVGFVGGYNVGSVYATQWRDTHLRLAGPAVWELENAFRDFWNMLCGEDQPRIADTGTPEWSPAIRAHRNVPELLIYPIRGMYLEAIDRAREHIYITQAYFIPDKEILHALIDAARRGVDVRILMPETSNHVVADWISRGFYGELLRGGVKLCLYQNAMVHAKTATIDGRWSTIGTANVDRLSLTGNYEINIEVFDPDLAAHLERVFAKDSTNARRLTPQEWAGRPLVAKLCESLLMPLRPLL
ncbi:phosphatidylserine/phosphatidylglycerophosphate/cardiolipin synthase family protein [Streptomonospora sp. PA3]|uniref:phospholipase D-like domain-containing protein n=1 Tax=Streptomonospora sp. PA3 TaxID=2607326 RepID=UPI0012DCA288|nr:phospholipase D-like domain-containing protein [Streptomonospora sp. PA3]MUL42944.1 phosphatidylserine/phosphatidylglycerophosphate/cardiolipin synthase family protein [Streptomonospora sp. PA3]